MVFSFRLIKNIFFFVVVSYWQLRQRRTKTPIKCVAVTTTGKKYETCYTHLQLRTRNDACLAQTNFEIADVTRPLLALSKLLTVELNVFFDKSHLSNGSIVMCQRRGGQHVMEAEVMGLCDDNIPGPEAESYQRSTQIPATHHHECKQHKIRDHVPCAASCSREQMPRFSVGSFNPKPHANTAQVNPCRCGRGSVQALSGSERTVTHVFTNSRMHLHWAQQSPRAHHTGDKVVSG